MKLFLYAYSRFLLPQVDQELWRRRYCPICSALAVMLNVSSYGSQDQDALAYFTGNDGLYRLYVCQHCQSYMKAIDLRQKEEETLLPLERLPTLDMDRQGQGKR